MHGFYTYLEANPNGHDQRFHELFVLDEPESALSFTGSLALVGLLARIATSETTQAIVATHSPIIAATPGARILEVNEAGLTERTWQEQDLVGHWTAFLADPDRYLHHITD